MLTVKKWFRYEFTVTVAGTLLAGLIHFVSFSKLSVFHWLLWVHSFICVFLGYVDHFCVGWKHLSVAVQIRRLLLNFILCLPLARLYLFIIEHSHAPRDISISKAVEQLTNYNTLYNIYHYWAPIVYWIAFLAFSLVFVSGYRFLTNLGVLLFKMLDDTIGITN